jgi:EmrB/QacA subfamily drug resistance transporter
MSPTRANASWGGLLAVLCGAQFVLQLDFSIVNVALPQIQRDLGFSAAGLQWIVTGYALTFGSLLLLGGRAGDLVGRRKLLLVGLLLFGVASLGSGLAPSPLTLVIARVVQGAAGAIVSPLALSVLTTTHAQGPQRTRALGIWQAATAAGATTGIIAGGLLTQYLGWRAVFLVNLPIIAVLLVLMRRLLPADGSPGSPHLDVRGAAAFSVSIAALIYGLTAGQQHGFQSPSAIISLGLAILLVIAFIAIEHGASDPLVPASLLTDRTRRVALAAMLLLGGIVAAYVYFISLYLQGVLGFTEVATGLALVPATGTVVVTSTFITRRALARLEPGLVLITGLAAITAGQLWLAHITTHGSYALGVAPGLLLTAFGMGLAFPTISVLVTNGVPPNLQGLAGGMFATAQQVGGAVGLAALATIAASRSAAHEGSLVDGYRLSYLVAAALAALGVVMVTARMYRATPTASRPRAEQGPVRVRRRHETTPST